VDGACAAAAGGNVILSATQTFTGFNQFLGSTTLALNGTNTEIWVASGSVSAVTTMTVTLTPYVVDAASASWRIQYQCRHTNANIIAGTFNQDTSADVYSELVTRIVASGASSGSGSGTSAECMQLTHLAIGAATYFHGEIQFQTTYNGLPNLFHYVGWLNGSDNVDTGSHYLNQYNGLYENPSGNAVTSFSLNGHTGACTSSVAPTGTFTCRWDLWRGRSWRGE